jgi:hypothetical protein
MDRQTVQGHIADAIMKHTGNSLDTTIGRLQELAVDRAESGKAGMVGYAKSGNRVATRVGRFIRQFFGDGLDDQTIQKIGADITALLWAGGTGAADNDPCELSGEDLRRFYLRSVSGIGSCMAGEDTQDFLDIYVDNPDVVKLATVRIGDCAARALVWTFTDGKRYMDRIYHTSDACCSALQLYADRNGIGVRENIPYGWLTVKIRCGEDSYWPYIDTLYYVDIVDAYTARLSRSDDGIYMCNQTDGTLYGRDEECCSCGAHIDEYEICSNNDGDIYCRACYSEAYTYCDCCEEDCPSDDMVITADDYTVCNYCTDRYYFTCDHCGGIYNYDDHSNDAGDKTVCDDCLKEHYFTCADCDAVCRVDELHNGPNNTTVCPDCAEQYATCSKCGKVLDLDAIVDGLCSDCAMDRMLATTGVIADA